MVTKAQALTATEFHSNGCARTYGPRGGYSESVLRVRRNGATQTWKTRPEAFRIPVKHGLLGYGQLTESDSAYWHVAGECPLNAPCKRAEVPHTCRGTECRV